MRVKRTIEVYDRCECGKALHSIQEGERGTCAACWFKTIPQDTKASLNRLISAALHGTTKQEKESLVDDAMQKLHRDANNRQRGSERQQPAS